MKMDECLSITLAFDSTPAFGAAMAAGESNVVPHALFHPDFVPRWTEAKAHLHNKKTDLGLACAKHKSAAEELAEQRGRAARGRMLAQQLLTTVRSDQLHPLFCAREGGACWAEVDKAMVSRCPHAARIGEGTEDRIAGLRRLYNRWKPPEAGRPADTKRARHHRRAEHQHTSKLALVQAKVAGKGKKKLAPWDKARVMYFCDHGEHLKYAPGFTARYAKERLERAILAKELSDARAGRLEGGGTRAVVTREGSKADDAFPMEFSMVGGTFPFKHVSLPCVR